MAASVIELEGVSLRRNGTEILQEISWQVTPGQQWAIVGANGSGKTTMLRVATGYLWPTRGAVRVLGKRFGQVDLRELRKSIGWVSSAIQQRMPPGIKAIEAVASGAFASIGLYEKPGCEQWGRARELMADLGIAGIADRTFGVLSLGERQRVLIARALMPDPPLLILDEPCAGLDLAAREYLLDLVDSLAAKQDGRSLVFVSHHVEEITPSFSHVLVLKDGQVHAAGSKQGVLTDAVLGSAFGLDIRVDQAGDRYWAQIHSPGPGS